MSPRHLIASLALAAATLPVFADGVPHIANIINFVRDVEPREVETTKEVLYQTVVSELESMKKNGLRGTFLLQYDALIDPQYQKLMKSLPKGFEVGAWWEITQPHVEKAGYTWRGRYPWDWHANVGFATGYTPEEREKLVDVYMEKFKEIFGKYPASVGSWFIDAHTLNYMVEKYHIVASCTCRDQVGTDGYTMWGGYWHGAYYPSKFNAYIPAQTLDNQINVPVFRMLGSDPLYQYDFGVGGAVQGVSTLEAVYSEGGGNEQWVDWYFKTVTQDPAMGYTYFQAGQENSFRWDRIQHGFELQMPKIAALAKKGILKVETLEESGRNFSKAHKQTPPNAVSAMSDYTNRDGKTLWFNSRYYRTNLFWEKGRFRFRDIQVFNEDNKSLYLTTPGTSTECHYFALPFVDGCLWSKPDFMAGLRLCETNGQGVKVEIMIKDQKISVKDNTTILTLSATSGTDYTITLSEKAISVKSSKSNKFCLAMTAAPGAKTPYLLFRKKEILAGFNDFGYSVSLKKGEFEKCANPNGPLFLIHSQSKQIELYLAQK